MVRFNLALLARTFRIWPDIPVMPPQNSIPANTPFVQVSASALAVTTHNDRRGLEVLDEAHFVSRDAPLMDLDRRQAQKQDSPEIQKLKEDRKAISPELDQAKQDLQTTRKAANAAIPQDLKDKEKAAKQKVKTTLQGLPDDKKNQLKDNEKAIQAERKKEKASASAPAAAPAPSAPAPAPAPAKF